MTTEHLVEIGYKSGNKIQAWFVTFNIDNGIYEWKLAESENISILLLNPNEIEYIIKRESR